MTWTHVVLNLGDLGTLEGIGLEGVTDLELLDVGQELFLELVVDLFMDKDSGTGAACLAVVEEDTCETISTSSTPGGKRTHRMPTNEQPVRDPHRQR